MVVISVVKAEIREKALLFYPKRDMVKGEIFIPDISALRKSLLTRCKSRNPRASTDRGDSGFILSYHLWTGQYHGAHMLDCNW